LIAVSTSAPPVAAAPGPAPSRPFGFDGASLNETLDAWRQSTAGRAGGPCAAAASARTLTVCSAPPLDLGGGYAARDLTFTFVDGRLARIAFRTSIDGFAFVTAALEKACGAPDAVVRDSARRMPHVSMRWRNGRSTIELSDPLPDYSHLGVAMTVDADAGRLPAIGG